MARRLPCVHAMAKSRKRDSGVPVLDRDTSAPQYAGDPLAADRDRERIAERAYQLYMERGGRDGRDLDDWLEAERELARRRQRDNSTPHNVA